MQDLTSPTVIRQIMQKFAFSCRKGLGQNFLADRNIVDKIIQAAQLQPGETVLEIGPGLGVLTNALGQENPIWAIEKDQRLKTNLTQTRYTEVKLIWADALEVDLAALLGSEKQVKIISNLPYYVTSPLVIRVLTSRLNWQSMVIMVQREVAERLTAAPGSKEYGSLSVLVNYYAQSKFLFKVPRTVFIPQPKVDSAVLILERRSRPAVEVTDPEFLFKIVRAAFGQRRKTLLNALAGTFPDWEKFRLAEQIEQAGIKPDCRGETLSLEQFAALSKQIQK
ncbi:MAG: 16S rRNA (adenine(1518)-N(6)/adenine(1519)-N(6))-dimethyltransferase RsmA [Clostridia bacterium]|nr:16S rRNA (adenine(1518)-N(6)/adenine(1519)-N(6))-dimethyltransferase RsmA [Clostridia bacterium]